MIKINSEIKKFILTGILNTVFYYSLFSLFIYIGIDYKYAVLFATVIGVLFSFKTFSKFVFNNNDNRLIFRFILVYIILYCTNILIIYLVNYIFLNYYISGFIATILCAILSFILNKKFVFKENKNG